MVERVLVPVDGSPPSRRALEFVAEEWPDASVVLVHVIDPKSGADARPLPSGSEEWYREAQAEAAELFETYREALPADVETRTTVGAVPEGITAVAEEADVDVVVVGSHGRTGVHRVLLGSVAEAVARRAPVPVTIVR
jgi:nucleotide-binding universal stress UspA family protein